MATDIFDNYAKIALEKGIIAEATPEELKKKLENDPRMDSLDISAIEALYGVKPDLPKGMEYKKNIVEDAHPNAVVISPSYDKLNGLVENLNERQNILLHIVNKTPDGHLTQRKYAEQNLMLALVRIANDLDNTGKEDLRKLADVCLEQTAEDIKKKDQLKKEAIGPLAIAGIVAVPLLVGALYLQQHLKFANEGFAKNHQKLIAELDDIIQSSSSVQTQMGAGQEYTAGFLKQMQDFRSKLMEFYGIYTRVSPVIDQIEQPRTAQDLVILAGSPKTDTIKKAYSILKTRVDNMLPYLETIEANFASETYKIRQVADKGWMQKVVDWTQVLHGGWGLIADDFDDVRRAIGPYKQSIAEILKEFEHADSLQADAKNKLDQARAESQQLMGGSPTEFIPNAPAPEAPGTTYVSSPGAQKGDLEEDLGIGKLQKDLEGLKDFI